MCVRFPSYMSLYTAGNNPILKYHSFALAFEFGRVVLKNIEKHSNKGAEDLSSL